MKKTARALTEARETAPTVEMVREAADALFRAATECCHQHDRVSRIVGKSNLDEELDEVQKMCETCSDSLRALTTKYETVSASVHPTGSDESWWHRANALWQASKEYLRRHNGCDVETRQLKSHGPGRLGALHTEYELEASALLALRQAADAYKRDRPIAA